MLNITDVRVKIVTPKEDGRDSKLKGIASMTIDNVFVVHDLKILQGDNELFVAMPSKKVYDNTLNKDTYKDIAHPLDSATREAIKVTIVKAYEAELKRK